MFLYTFIVRCVLIKEDDYTGFPVFQTPHIRLTFLIVSVVTKPCLVHIHVGTVLTLYFHELIALNEGLLMKVVGIPLIVFHTNFTLVFQHKHVNVSIQRISVISAADYLAYMLGFTSHIVKFHFLSPPVFSAPDSLSYSSECTSPHGFLSSP